MAWNDGVWNDGVWNDDGAGVLGGGTGDITGLIPKVWVYGIDPLGASATSLIAGHPHRGRIGTVYGNTLGTQTEADSLVDITDYVELCDIRIGKRRSLDSYDPGRCLLQLDATDRRFDPFAGDGAANIVGAYAIESISGIRKNLFARGRRVRVVLVHRDAPTVAEFYLWSGFIDLIETEYAQAPTSPLIHTTVDCVDGFDVLARYDGLEVEPRGAHETVGPRIRRILEMARWTAPNLQGPGYVHTLTVGDAVTGRIGTAYDNKLGEESFSPDDTGSPTSNAMFGYGWTGNEGAAPMQATNLAQNALTLIKAAAASDGGQVWMDRAGRVRWTTRGDMVTPGPLTQDFLFTDEGDTRIEPFVSGFATTYVDVVSSTMFDQPTFAADTDELVTVASMAAEGQDTVRVEDTEAIAEFGSVTYSRTDLMCESQTDVRWVAEHILATHKNVLTRVTGVRVWPTATAGGMYMAAVPELESTGAFESVSKNVFRYVRLIGVHHTIRPNALDGWTCDLTLTEA